MCKRVINIVLCVILLFSFVVFRGGESVEGANISATSYVVVEYTSNRILYQKNKDQKLPMASTTKIMTAILALEEGNLNDIVNIKKEYTMVEGSSAYLREGEKLSLEDLLHCLLLISGNDSAIAIACHIGGSVEGFAKMMNKKAIELGMKNTNFKNPNGLPDEEHYTTAYDFALLASYAMKNKDFVKIINDKKWSMSYEGKENGRVIYNKNKLLNSYEGANGIKTGYTKKADKCFVFAAKRNDMQLVGVLLKSYDHYTDSKNLLDMAFSEYSMKKIILNNQYIKTLAYENDKNSTINLTSSKEVLFPLKGNEEVKINHDKIYNSGNNNFFLNYSVIIGEEKYPYELKLNSKIKKQGLFDKYLKLLGRFIRLK